MKSIFAISFLFIATLISCAQKSSSEKSKKIADNKVSSTVKTDTALFGTGCFWCTEAIFQELEGVLKVTSGYAGGHVASPSYEEVCSKTTGHAESLQIIYDPTKITYDELLEVFWQTHDPTTLNRQGNDEGPQYRSVIFYYNDAQKKKAEHYKAELDKSGAFGNPIVTAIEAFRNANQPYCSFVIRPKVEKFEKVFKSKLKK